MVPVIPWYITLAVVAIHVAIAVTVWRILAADAPRRVRIGLGIFLFGWLGLVLALAPAPGSLLARDRFYLTPLIPFFAAGSFVVALAALRLSPSLRRAVATASLPAMIGVQVYRTIGALFLILLALGQLPAYFALPAGWGDIAVGVTAPIVALALLRGAPRARSLAISWNVFGLLDLVVAVGMGTGFLAPFLAPELGGHVPPAAAMGVFPLVLVPTFTVPVSVLLHVLALGRLLRESRVDSRRVPKPAGRPA
jgi:hypothetical protein